METEEPTLQFTEAALHTPQVVYSKPKKYLYIPNNALLKSGAFNYITQHFEVEKLDVNTHLYTSDQLKKALCRTCFGGNSYQS